VGPDRRHRDRVLPRHLPRPRRRRGPGRHRRPGQGDHRRIDLVHANDSKDKADSGRDRHENLGKGQIDLDTLVGIVQAAGAPVICETPGPAEAHRADIALLRSELGGR
jgi:endonuclease IV